VNLVILELPVLCCCLSYMQMFCKDCIIKAPEGTEHLDCNFNKYLQSPFFLENEFTKFCMHAEFLVK
jgi:hypothetical protein